MYLFRFSIRQFLDIYFNLQVPELKAINGPSIYAGKVIKVKSTQSSPPIAKNILAEQEMETEEVTIKLGDTLSNLALKLGTTV